MPDQTVFATSAPRWVLMPGHDGEGVAVRWEGRGAGLGSRAPSLLHKRLQLSLPYRDSCLSSNHRFGARCRASPRATPRTGDPCSQRPRRSFSSPLGHPYLSSVLNSVRDVTQSSRCVSVILSLPEHGPPSAVMIGGPTGMRRAGRLPSSRPGCGVSVVYPLPQGLKPVTY